MALFTNSKEFESHPEKSDKPREICKYFLYGKCRYGKGCRNSHAVATIIPDSLNQITTEPKPTTSSPTGSNLISSDRREDHSLKSSVLTCKKCRKMRSTESKNGLCSV